MSHFCQEQLETQKFQGKLNLHCWPLFLKYLLLASIILCLTESPGTPRTASAPFPAQTWLPPPFPLIVGVLHIRVTKYPGLPGFEGSFLRHGLLVLKPTVLDKPGWLVYFIHPHGFTYSRQHHLLKARNLGVIILRFSVASELPNLISSPSQVILDSVPSKSLNWTISIPSVSSAPSPPTLSMRLP